jgi:hypothetical protein
MFFVGVLISLIAFGTMCLAVAALIKPLPQFNIPNRSDAGKVFLGDVTP